MTDRNDEISTLNTLTATLIDSITGYEDAAANSEAGRFREMFRERVTERQSCVEDLRAEVRRLGGNPEDDGSFMGKTHQRFLDLKAALTGRDEKAIINEVERGEDYLKEKFETALNSERATERQSCVEDLRAEVRRLGGNPEDDGSFMGKTHQRFLDLKAALTGRDEKAIINEVERGEDYLKEEFETALNSEHLSGESRTVVERAFQSVRAGHDQMSQLKHGMEAD